MFLSVLEALVRGCTGFEPYGARKCVNQHVRTPARASTKFLVWLKTKASMVSLCAEKSCVVIAICTRRLHGHTHATSTTRRPQSTVSDCNDASNAFPLKKRVWQLCRTSLSCIQKNEPTSYTRLNIRSKGSWTS